MQQSQIVLVGGGGGGGLQPYWVTDRPKLNLLKVHRPRVR